MSAAQMTRVQVVGASPLEITIEGYGYGGEGFVTLADGWLSIPNALPGERVVVEVDPPPSEHARRLWGRLVRVVEAHPERVDPQCARAAVCRGCQLRHMSVSEELRFKRDTIHQVLEKFAGLPRETHPEVEHITPQPLLRADAERIRSALTYRRRADGYELGLVSPAHPHLIPMHDCPALVGSVRRPIRQVHDALDQAAAAGMLPADGHQEEAAARLTQIRVAAPMHGHGFVVLDLERDEDGALEECALRHPELSALVEQLDATLSEEFGVFLTDGDEVLCVRGPEALRLPMLPETRQGLRATPRDWFHATLRPALALYDAVLDWLDPSPEDAFLDVGCGIGTIALRVAPHVQRALGLDHNRSSILQAEANAALLELEHVRFMTGGWERGLRRLCAEVGQTGGYSLATINPMRAPVGGRALAYLGPLGVQRLVYLGPSPTSASRDVGELCQRGWSLERLGSAMLHPGTYHTMMVALLCRAQSECGA